MHLDQHRRYDSLIANGYFVHRCGALCPVVLKLVLVLPFRLRIRRNQMIIA